MVVSNDSVRVFYSVLTNQVVFSVSIPDDAAMTDDEFDSDEAHGKMTDLRFSRAEGLSNNRTSAMNDCDSFPFASINHYFFSDDETRCRMSHSHRHDQRTEGKRERKKRRQSREPT